MCTKYGVKQNNNNNIWQLLFIYPRTMTLMMKICYVDVESSIIAIGNLCDWGSFVRSQDYQISLLNVGIELTVAIFGTFIHQ